MGLDSDHTASGASIWVAHDGELDDVCRLLDELGAHWSERRGRIDFDDCPDRLRAVIATPQRLLEARFDARFDAESGPLRVAIAEQATRTVASMLRRTGVERIVTRPVHPAALRALLLHTIYCGPEKRRRLRVSVGAPVRLRCGLIPRHAILAELSTRGCRLLTAYAARRDTEVRISIPSRVTGEGRLSVQGRVVRTGPASGENAGTQSIVVIFSSVDRQRLNRLQKLVDTHAAGPATLPSSRMAPPRLADPATPAIPSIDRSPVSSTPPLGTTRPRGPAPPSGPECAELAERPAQPEPPAAESLEAAQGSERRTGLRCEYEHSVIVLSAEAARVLIGRDISVGGMRVEPHGDLALGDQLQLALHVGDRREPLVVRADIVRDDGNRGLVLRFCDLSESASEAIVEMVDGLALADAAPDPENRGECEGSDDVDAHPQSQVVVSEILEHVQG